MTREEAHDLVRQLVVAVNAHDAARLADFYSDDAVLVSPMFPGIVGRSAIAKNWESIFALFPDWKASVSDVLVDGERIAFLGTAGATDRNGWFGEPPTGERIEYRAVIVLTMARGKIVRDERIYDLAGVLQRLEKSRLDKELRLAAEVQRVLLSRSRRQTTYCEAMGDSIASRAIGGDFFELTQLPSAGFAVALGDVAGKGPASALLASMIQGMLAMELDDASSPAATLARLNRLLFRRGLEPRFATLVYGILSPSGRFIYCNAGHNPPMVLTHNRIRRLTTGGGILGAFDEAIFQEETLDLTAGETIIMFSDGVIDARNPQGEEFGEDRLISCLETNRASPVEILLRSILECVRDFCQGSAPGDDITVTVTRFQPASFQKES